MVRKQLDRGAVEQGPLLILCLDNVDSYHWSQEHIVEYSLGPLVEVKWCILFQENLGSVSLSLQAR